MIWRLFTCSGSGTDPYRNLALERYLTETVPEDACVLYLWQNQNTVVIGRNQNAWKECRTGLLEQEGGVLEGALNGCAFSAGALCRALEGAAVPEEIRDDLCRLIRAQNI